MSFDVNQLRLGMNLEGLKNSLNTAISLNKGNVNELVLKSIFNFIEDDITVGDGKISNENELHVLVSYIKNLFNKDAKPEVKMPDAANYDPEKDLLRRNEDENFSNTIIVENFESGQEKETSVQKYKQTGETNVETTIRDNSGYDMLYDENNDGVVDARTVTFADITDENGKLTTYRDTDLDGSFDQKTITVVKDGKMDEFVEYKRKDDGNWGLDV